MTSSRDDLPPGLQSMWRLVKLGYSAEPKLLVFAFAMVVFAALPDALLALWLALLAQGVEDNDRTVLMIAAAGIGLSAVATWFLRVVGDRTQRRFRDRVTIFLESHVARLQASVSTIEHHERPDYLDRLSVLRNQVFTLDHMYMSVFSTAGWILRLGVTVILLMSVSPWLVLLVAFALPTVLTASWRPGIERAAEERVASRDRLARHLFLLGTTAPPGKEVRLTGIGSRLVEQRQDAWHDWYEPVARARWSSAFWHTIAWAIFGGAYVGAVVFVASVLDASVGAVLAGARGRQPAVAVRRCDRRRDRVPARHLARRRAPPRLARGLRARARRGRRPAGAGAAAGRHPARPRVVPLPGYRAARARRRVARSPGRDGRRDRRRERRGQVDAREVAVPLLPTGRRARSRSTAPTSRGMPADAWRARLAGAFQDFFRFELVAAQTVGLGDLERLERSSRDRHRGDARRRRTT